jgi:hypothetical protein
MTATPTLPRYIRLHCASCNKALGWREARENTRWILALCDDCYEKDKAEHERHSTATT